MERMNKEAESSIEADESHIPSVLWLFCIAALC